MKLLNNLILIVILIGYFILLTTIPVKADEPAIILGRLYKSPVENNCPNNRFVLGDNCGIDSCKGLPNYTISWTQENASSSLQNNNCQGGLPRYTFEWQQNPLGNPTGKPVTVTVNVPDSAFKITNWFRNTTYSNGNTCAPLESGGFASPGNSQTITVNVYRDGDCKWNHVWFYYEIPPSPTPTPTVRVIPTSTPTPTTRVIPTPTLTPTPIIPTNPPTVGCTNRAPACPAGYVELLKNTNMDNGTNWNWWTDGDLATKLTRGTGELGIGVINNNQRACWHQGKDVPTDPATLDGFTDFIFSAEVWQNKYLGNKNGFYISINRRFFYPKSDGETQIWCNNYGGDKPSGTGVYYMGSAENTCSIIKATIPLNHPMNAVRANFCVWNGGSARPAGEGYVNWMSLCGKPTKKIQGGYSKFSECSTSACGTTGTQERQCNNPRPIYGGDYCPEDIDTASCKATTPDYESSCCQVTERDETKECTNPPCIISTPTPTPAALSSWIQVFGGDVHAAQDINSGKPLTILPPLTVYFIDNILNNDFSAGVFSSGSSTDPGYSNISNPNDWLALEHKYNFLQGRKYDYSYFLTNLVGKLEDPAVEQTSGSPVTLEGSTLSGDTGTGNLTSIHNYWKIIGNLNVSDNLAPNLSGQIFLVSGDITINKDLIANGTIPIFISNGNITVSEDVQEINGIFITSGTFEVNGGSNPLKLDSGSAISYSSFTFGRTFTSNTTPSEKFIYNPFYLVKLAGMLGRYQTLWQEVAP